MISLFEIERQIDAIKYANDAEKERLKEYAGMEIFKAQFDLMTSTMTAEKMICEFLFLERLLEIKLKRI